MKFLGFNKVLCLAPHPDDVEYSMGGTIIKHYNTQFDVLCLTQGGDCDITTGNSNAYVGTYAGKDITTGSGNACLGYEAGVYLTSGST